MTQHNLLHSLCGFVSQHRLIQPGEKILVSVSGGIDSIVLLDLLCELRKQIKMELAVIHCNHKLRGKESDDDEIFVINQAKERNLEFYSRKIDVRKFSRIEKISIQEAARKARYLFFYEIKTSANFDKIATGHNADDNAETIIFNLLRGTGIKGLTGIPVWRKDQAIIRPLLFATRDEIRNYANSRKLNYREDSSNLKTDYRRNYIRHKIIPLVQERINPNLTYTLKKTGERFFQLEEYIKRITDTLQDKLILEKKEEEFVIDLRHLNELPEFLQEYFLRDIARIITDAEINSGTVDTMLSITKGETGSFGSIKKDIILYRDRDRLIFKKIHPLKKYSIPIESGNTYLIENKIFTITEVKDFKISEDPGTEFIDGEKLQRPLHLRPWEKGDWFIPIGMTAPKKISDFFIDHKIPLFEKKSIPLFVSGEDIVWVCGLRLDERFKITDKTKKIIKLSYRKL